MRLRLSPFSTQSVLATAVWAVCSSLAAQPLREVEPPPQLEQQTGRESAAPRSEGVSARAYAQANSMARGGGVTSLGDIVRTAVEHDPQVLSTQAQERAAAARVAAARSRWFPTLGVNSTKGHNVDKEGRVAVDRAVAQTSAELRMNLYNGGADSNEVRATELEVEAARQEVRKAQEEVAERVSEAYFEWARQDAMLKVVTEHLSSVRVLDERVAEQQRQGKASDADRLQLASSLLNAQTALNDVRNARTAAQVRLAALMSWPIDAPLLDQLGEHLQPYRFPPSLQAEAQLAAAVNDAQAVPNSPVVSVALTRAAAALSRVNSVPATLAPRLDVNAKQHHRNTSSPANFTVPQRSWSLGMTWEFPLGGETLHRRSDIEQRAVAAAEDAERAAQSVRAELFSLPARIGGSHELLPRLQTQADYAARLAVTASDLFDAGRRTVQQLVQSQEVRYDLAQRLAGENHKLSMALMRRLVLRGEWLSSFGASAESKEMASQPASLPKLTLPVALVPVEPAPVVAPPPAKPPVLVAPAPVIMEPVAPSAPPPPPPPAPIPVVMAPPVVVEAPPPPPPPPLPDPPVVSLTPPRVLDASEVPSAALRALSHWSRALTGRHAPALLDSYAADFAPSGLTPSAWREAQRERLRSTKAVEVGPVQWRSLDANTVQAQFMLDIRHENSTSAALKRLNWREEGGVWLIVKETPP